MSSDQCMLIEISEGDEGKNKAERYVKRDW